MKSLIFLLSFILLAVATPMDARAQNTSPLAVDISAHNVAITTSFVGSNLLLFGTTGGKGDVIIVVRGPRRDEVVRRKEKIAGIWVNRDNITFDNIPSFYTVASSRPVEDILSNQALEANRIGFNHLALEASDAQGLNTEEISVFRDALVRRKQIKNLYASDPMAISFIKSGLFRMNLSLPANIVAGDYEVDTFLIRKGRVVSAETDTLPVQKVGFEAEVYNFAYQYSLAYGVLAVLIAIVAGWIASVAFRKG